MNCPITNRRGEPLSCQVPPDRPNPEFSKGRSVQEDHDSPVDVDFEEQQLAVPHLSGNFELPPEKRLKRVLDGIFRVNDV